jgi:hypothetical protein
VGGLKRCCRDGPRGINHRITRENPRRTGVLPYGQPIGQPSIKGQSSSLIQVVLLLENPPTTRTNPLEEETITTDLRTPGINRGLG